MILFIIMEILDHFFIIIESLDHFFIIMEILDNIIDLRIPIFQKYFILYYIIGVNLQIKIFDRYRNRGIYFDQLILDMFHPRYIYLIFYSIIIEVI